MLNGLSPLGDNPMDMSPNSLFAQNTFANSPPMQRESSWRRMEEGAGACRPRPWLSGQAAASHTTPAQFPGATAPSLVSLGSHSQLLPCPPRIMQSVGALGPVDMDHQAALAIGQSFEQASLQAKPASPSDPPTPKSKRARTPKSKAETGRKDAVEGTVKAALLCLLVVPWPQFAPHQPRALTRTLELEQRGSRVFRRACRARRTLRRRTTSGRRSTTRA
jgi:hypothetical protein